MLIHDNANGTRWWIDDAGQEVLWSSSNGNIFNTNEGGRVGINTVDPKYALDVKGTISADRVLGVDWPDIKNKIIPVQSDWKEENTLLLSFIKNRPEYLTRDDINMVYSIMGALLAAYLAALGISAFSGSLGSFFRRLFGGDTSVEGEDGDDGEDGNVFDDKIIDLIRKTLNPPIVTCMSVDLYDGELIPGLKSYTYGNSSQPRLFVNWSDNLFGNPIYRPCSATIPEQDNFVGILRSLVLSSKAKLYIAPASLFQVDEYTKNVKLVGYNPNQPFIDFETRSVSLLNIPTSFKAPGTAKIKTIDAHDFEGNAEGVLIQFPTIAQRIAYDAMERANNYDPTLITTGQLAAIQGCILSVRNPDFDAQGGSFIPIIDWKGQYLQKIHPNQVLSSEALNNRNMNDGAVNLNRDPNQPSVGLNEFNTNPDIQDIMDRHNRGVYDNVLNNIGRETTDTLRTTRESVPGPSIVRPPPFRRAPPTRPPPGIASSSTFIRQRAQEQASKIARGNAQLNLIFQRTHTAAGERLQSTLMPRTVESQLDELQGGPRRMLYDGVINSVDYIDSLI